MRPRRMIVPWSQCFRLSLFAWAVLLTCVRSLILTDGQVTVSSAADAEVAVRDLENHQTIVFTEPVIRLSKTIIIQDLINITIKGSPTGTTIVCPPESPIMKIIDSSVHMESVSFVNCSGQHSAVEVIKSLLNDASSEVDTTNPDDLQPECSVEMTSCEFQDNTKLSNNLPVECGNSTQKLGGAGIVSCGCSVSLKKTSFARNTAISGGAIAVTNTNLTIRESFMVANNATSVGGALTAMESVVIVNTTDFNEDTANFSAAAVLLIEGISSFSECTFRSNRASNAFGGAVSVESGSASFSACRFLSNGAGDSGGALFVNRAEIFIANCSFVRNSASWQGGAVMGQLSLILIYNTEFTNNSVIAADGGAVLSWLGTIICNSTAFDGNKAENWGGAVAIIGGEGDFQNCGFDRNRVENTNESGNQRRGAGVYVTGGKARLTGCTVENGWSANDGGAACAWESDVRFENCTFLSNRCRVNGGAISTWSTSVVLSGCVFEGNKAERNGGGYQGWIGQLNVTNCRFTNNSAIESAGAINVAEITFSCSSSNFTRNSAELLGGAVSTEGQESRIENSIYENNSAAVAGGALYHDRTWSFLDGCVFNRNQARFGGAVFLQKGSQLTIRGKTVFFKANKAKRGGALSCNQCGQLDHLVAFCDNVYVSGMVLIRDGTGEFENNSANDRGGAFFLDTGAGIRTQNSSIRFINNSASVGGAIYVKNLAELTINDQRFPTVNALFENNSAITGGALYFISGNAASLVITIRSATFTGNQAISVPELNEHTNGTVGIGGAIYIMLHHFGNEPSVRVSFEQLDIQRNVADVGGGAYMDFGDTGKDHFTTRYCRPLDSVSEPCYRLSFKNVNVTQNTANISGGGVFLGTAIYFKYFCEEGIVEPSIEDPTISKTGCLSIWDNGLETKSGASDSDVGTDAVRMRIIESEHDSFDLVPGSLLAFSNNGVSDKKTAPAMNLIKVRIEDLFGNQIRSPTKDSDLAVILISPNIGDQIAYVAHDGVVAINETRVFGVQLNGSLEIRAGDGRNAGVSLNFSTKSCPEGGLEEAGICVRCGFSEYSFNGTHPCVPCEPHAACVGTTVLVPEDGYWHSTPFSPRFIPCLTREACSGSGRLKRLVDFYNTSEFILSELEALDRSDRTMEHYSETYPQCSEAYDGPLCASCAPDHGRSASGRCVPCPDSRMGSFAITALSIIIFAFIFSFRLWLEWNGTKKDVSLKIAQNASIDVRNIQLVSIPYHIKYRRRRTKSDTSFDASALYSQHHSEESTFELGSQLQDVKPLPGRSSSQPPAMQCVVLKQTPINTESPETVAATKLFTATFNILFDYIQLNSFAISLGFEWNESMNVVLSTQGTIARITSVARLYPFECNLPVEYRDHDKSVTIVTVYIHALFPLVVLGIYLSIFQVWSISRRSKTPSARNLHSIPTLTFVFLSGFFSYVIDIVGEFFRIMSFAKLPDPDPSHIYARYDILEDRHLWSEDSSVAYMSGAHLWGFLLSLVGILACIWVLIRTSQNIRKGFKTGRLDDPEFMKQFGFLYHCLRQEGLSLHWSAIVTTRTIILSFLLNVFSPINLATSVRIVILFTVIFVSYLIHTVINPFNEEIDAVGFPSYSGYFLESLGASNLASKWRLFNDTLTMNSMNSAAILVSLCTYTFAGALSERGASDFSIGFITSMTVLVNGVFTCFLFYRLWLGAHHLIDKKTKHLNLPHKIPQTVGDNVQNTWLVWKAWNLWREGKKRQNQGNLDLFPNTRMINENA